MNIDNWLGSRTVYVVEAGSHAYGTNTPESDYDYRGACIPPKSYFFGLNNFEQADGKNTGKLVSEAVFKTVTGTYNRTRTSNNLRDSDITIWSLEKLIKLAADGNPNMIELLFTDESNIVFIDKSVMQPFLDIRESFLSKLLKHRFSGYAMHQLKRMRNHHNWMKKARARPTREQFGIEEVKFPKDQLLAAEKLIELQVDGWLVDQTHLPEDIKIQLGPEMVRMINVVLEQIQIETNVDSLKDILERAATRVLGFDSKFLYYLGQEKAYRGAMAEYKAYENWKKNRNPVRAKIEKEIGFDSKHALHLVRLMRMAREILETGKVHVKRPDAQELLAIRNGAWTYEQVIEWAETEDKALNDVMEKSKLPKSPNRKKINRVLTEVTDDYLRRAEN